MKDQIVLLNEEEILFALKKLIEKHGLQNYGDTLSYLNQITLKRYFRHIGEEKHELIMNSQIMKTIKINNQESLKSLKQKKKITFESEPFEFNGKKYNFKGTQIFIKITIDKSS